jgi:hypothetical protein
MKKKIMGVLACVLLLLISSSVLAAGYAPNFDSNGFSKMSVKLNITTDDDYIVQVKEHGLNNAILVIKKNETQQHLTEVLSKIQAKDVERMNKLSTLTITKNDGGKTQAHGFIKSKLFGVINTERLVTYNIGEDGSVTEKRKLAHVFYRDVNNSEDVG